MRSSAKSIPEERKRNASIKTIRLRKRARMMELIGSDEEVEDYDSEGSVVDQVEKEPEVIDLCDRDSDVSDEDKVEDEIDEFDGIESIEDEFDGIGSIEDGFDGIEDIEDDHDGPLPGLSHAFADLDGAEIADDPGSPDLARDQALPGDSDDESSSEPEIQSPKSSPKEARQEALLVLKERRRISKDRPKGIKREESGLRRKYRQPTPDSDPFEIYSSEDEEPYPKTRVVPDSSIPSRKHMKRYFEGRAFCILPNGSDD